ncbi:MAG: type II secretion system F family protein [Candidatus Omnitrophica bacterium]|nr:type II secretion system F family protein [Candidatus Omnitrophota bacterium]
MSHKEKAIFYRQLSLMLESGLPLFSALDAFLNTKLYYSTQLKVSRLRNLLTGGLSLSRGLSEAFGDSLTSLERAVITVGERSGTLPESLRNLSAYFEFILRTRTRLFTGLLYPIILLHAAVIIPAIPVLILKGPAPFLSTVVPFILVFYGPYLLCRLLSPGRFQTVKESVDRWVLFLPVIGPLIRSLSLLRFYQAWLCIYSAGVDLREGLPLAAETAGNATIAASLAKSFHRLTTGTSLSECLADNPYLPESVKEQIKTGEISGKLEQTLSYLVTTSEQEVNTYVDRLLTVLPVAVYLLVAGYTGYVIISFYRGYFQEIGSLLQ